MRFADGLHEERLDNGLRVLVRPHRAAPLVSVWCWYHVGSKDEQPGLTGISHFVEHMNFKGTRNVSREQLKVWIERAGGTWNGYTWVDQTTYYETLAAEELELALRIEAERMHECLYDEAEFASEKTVVLAELHGNENDPAYLLHVDVVAAALRMHPYRWPTIGWRSDLEAMTRDDLWRHYRTWYVPGNATLVIAGDVDVKEAVAAARRRFGQIEPGEPPPRVRVREPEQDRTRRVLLERPGTTAYLELVVPAPAFAQEEFVPALLLDALLAGGKGANLLSGGFGRNARTTSPLYRALVETELAVTVGTALLPTEQPYLYEIVLTLRDGVEHRRAEAALCEVLDRVCCEAVSDRALQKARNQVLASLAFESERVSEIAHQIGYYATIGTVEQLDEVPERVAAVTAEEIRALAERMLAPAHRTIGWFVPMEDA